MKCSLASSKSNLNLFCRQCFLVAGIIQGYFLTLPYSRNWRYLWSSQHAPTWTIAILIIAFFIGVWTALLSLFSKLSTCYPWIVPIFAIGLGAPRWGQILWSTSSMGSWLPWASSPVSGALMGRALWLWLGVLDAIQQAGLGMMLLQTLTRVHVVFTVVAAQILATVATMIARATSPPFYDGYAGAGSPSAVSSSGGTGSGSHGSGGGGRSLTASNNVIFPNFALDDGVLALRGAWFWTALLLQIGICVGFFRFFRREQLAKP